MKIAAAFLLLVFSLSAQAPAPAKSALDKPTLEAYLRYAELWIPQVTVKIDDPKPSAALDGFYDVGIHLTFNGSTKDELYYVSKDGKNIVKGQLYEIGKSPFQSNLSLLKTDQLPNYGAGANAVVNLVVFSDFQCPYCQKEEMDLRKNLPMAFGDKVRVSFADFPLTQIHPWAMKGSIAGRCMYRTSPAAFWDYHDWVYQNQNDIKLENFDTKLAAVAALNAHMLRLQHGDDIMEWPGCEHFDQIKCDSLLDPKLNRLREHFEVAARFVLSSDQVCDTPPGMNLAPSRRKKRNPDLLSSGITAMPSIENLSSEGENSGA